MEIKQFVGKIGELANSDNPLPWDVTENIAELILTKQKSLGDEYSIKDEIAVHSSAVIEQNVIIKGPMIVGPNSFIAANCYIRGGVYVGANVKIGPSCELKQSVIFDDTSIAHLNYVGNSLIGSNVNLEAGVVLANHYNERSDKTIVLSVEGAEIRLPTKKFGAVIGDGSKIGANSVTCPGTFLNKNTVIKRLELVDQSANDL